MSVASLSADRETAELVRSANAALRAGDLRGAVEQLGQALSRTGDRPELLSAYGHLQLNLGAAEAAEDAALRSAAIAPNLPETLTLLGRLWLLGRHRPNELDCSWSKQEYILSQLPSVSRDFYEQHKDLREVEHQVGRFLNMQQVANEIISGRIEGDIVEFGTWQGLGLLMLGRCFATDAIPRKLIGIDSFEGLPEDSTIWKKGLFNDTSLDRVRGNIESRLAPGQSFKLIKGWFNDRTVPESLTRECSSIALVHFDADLASSTRQALGIIEPYLVGRTAPMYFLFDDWGCNPDEVPDAFLNWLPTARVRYGMEAHKVCTTRITRYYKMTFAAR